VKPFSCQPLLAFQFGVNQRTRDLQFHTVALREGLNPAQQSIAGRRWPDREQDFPGGVQHHERRANISKPLQGAEGREPGEVGWWCKRLP